MSEDFDLPPELDDFTEVIEKVKQKEEKNQDYVGDYTLTREQIEKEQQEQIQQQLQVKMAQKQLEQLELQEKQEKERKKQLEEEKKSGKKKSNGGGLFGGMKGGFLSKKKPEPKQQNNNQNKQKIQEVKYNKEKAEGGLKLGEVQESMKMGDYLNSNKDQWMNNDLMQQIGKNPDLMKLFTNPEYNHAITMMQKEPKKAMEIYGKNPEFMMLFQQFCKVMGNHFQGLGKQDQQKQQQEQQQQQQKPLIQEIKKKTEEDIQVEQLQEKLKDPKIMAVMQEPKVQKFLQILQSQKGIDFHAVMRSDPELAQKIQFLIQNKIINLQHY